MTREEVLAGLLADVRATAPRLSLDDPMALYRGALGGWQIFVGPQHGAFYLMLRAPEGQEADRALAYALLEGLPREWLVRDETRPTSRDLALRLGKEDGAARCLKGCGKWASLNKGSNVGICNSCSADVQPWRGVSLRRKEDES